MKIALAMIVKPTDQEAWLLNRCLGSVAAHVDGIFITQAGPEANAKVSEVIKDWQGVESFYKWNDSFADARNFNFAQVPEDYDYILWLDADDVLRGGEKLQATIQDNPSVDAFSLWYLYAFDRWKNPIVVHHKARIIRNDGCVEWRGDLHEDFVGHRQVVTKHVEGIEVLHLTDEDRIEDSKKRNVVVAKKQLKAEPDDPRSYWNVANSLKADMKLKQALKHFKKFLATSQSQDEKYIARLRMAECEYNLGDNEAAIEHYQMAIGLKPMYPDAYIQLGRLYYETGQYKEAVPLLKHSLTMEPPVYSIIVYNPRDYDYTPMKWLAYCYLEMGQPILAYELFKSLLEITPKDEQLRDIVKSMKKTADTQEKMLERYSKIKDLPKDELKKELDNLPNDWKSNPMFTNLRNVNFIRTESSGKDMSILCGYTSREWDASALKTGVGGSEEAVIHLAKIYADSGWNVTVYNNCGHKEIDCDGVTYAPFWTWNYRDKVDVTILWRHPKMLDYEINSTKIFLDLHDVIGPGELNKKRVARVDKIFVKSKFHKSLYPQVPKEKFVVVPNGIDPSQFVLKEQRDPFLMINTSSADRSVSAMIRLFPKIKALVPDAKLEWAYGWGTYEAAHKGKKDQMEWKERMQRELKEAGIKELGMVSQDEVASMYRRARIFFYPTEFAEIDCISARKAQAGGAIPVTTDFGALNETVQFGYKVHSKKTKDTWSKPYQFDFGVDPEHDDEFVKVVVEILTSTIDEELEMEMNHFALHHSWQNVGDTWLKEIES